MFNLTELLNELTGRNTLHVYDFDDTIVKTDTPIIVVGQNGSRRALTSHEYATYVAKPGETFDFTEFDKMIRSSKPIDSNIDQLRASLDNPNIKTTILTARRIAFPIMKHLRDAYKMNVYVVGVGSSDPEKKADYIENEVKRGYTTVRFVDDSDKNLSAVAARLRKYNINLELINALSGKTVSERYL